MKNEAIASVQKAPCFFPTLHQEQRVVINKEQLVNMLMSLLHTQTATTLANMMVNILSESFEYCALLQGKNACMRTSLLFNPQRLSVRVKDRRSVTDLLKDKHLCEGLARAMVWKSRGGYEHKSDVLYQACIAGCSGSQVVSDFRPYVARSFCVECGVQKDSRVLDPCAGWGGRMLGVSTVCDNYHAFDPCQETMAGLKKTVEFINYFRESFAPEFECLPFEDAKLAPASYDFAITSPPYYDTEEYSTSDTDSAHRYKSFKEWTNEFFLVLIQKTMRALRPGRSFVLNVCDRRYPLKTIVKNYCKGRYNLNESKKHHLPKMGIRGKDEDIGESFLIITNKNGVE